MGKLKNKTIEKFKKEYVKTHRYLAQSRKTSKFYYFCSLLLQGISAYVFVLILIDITNEFGSGLINWMSITKRIFSGLGIAFSGIGTALFSVKGPNSFEKLLDWRWNTFRKFLIYVWLSIISGYLYYFFPFEEFLSTIDSTFFLLSFFLIHFIILTIMVFSPKLILSSFLGGIGSSATIFGFYLFFLQIIGSLFPNKGLIFLVFFSISSPIVFFLLKNQYKKNNLSLIQRSAIQFVHPDYLLISLRDKNQEFRDRRSAIDIKLEVEKELSPGEKKELVQLYIEESNTNQKKWRAFGLVIGFIWVLGFILKALGKSYIDEVIYIGFLRPILVQCKLIPPMD